MEIGKETTFSPGLTSIVKIALAFLSLTLHLNSTHIDDMARIYNFTFYNWELLDNAN